MKAEFWSSVVLTGNPTQDAGERPQGRFWSSVVLTGNPTDEGAGTYGD